VKYIRTRIASKWFLKESVVPIHRKSVQKMDLFNNISLSARTVARRVEDIAYYIVLQFYACKALISFISKNS
jgi:hypothetical protein